MGTSFYSKLKEEIKSTGMFKFCALSNRAPGPPKLPCKCAMRGMGGVFAHPHGQNFHAHPLMVFAPKLPPPHGLLCKCAMSRTPPIGTRVFGEGGGGSAATPPKTAAAASARGCGGPRAAEDGAKRHSSGGDRCLGVRVSLIMLVWNSGKPVLFRVQWLGRPGARRGTAPPTA